MSNDASRIVVIRNPQGLHLRPAHGFASLAATFASEVQVSRDGESVDGKSILSLVTLAASEGTELTVQAVGADAEEAVAKLSEFLENIVEPDEATGEATS